MFTRIFGGVLLATLTLTPAFFPALAQDSPQRRVTVVFDHALPNVPGKSLKGVLVEYGPGASSCSHRPPASADRKSVVSGKSGSVRLALGGRGFIKKKNATQI